MGKISPVSAKYIVHATINIDGVVDKPDVIGAIFGQTEGLLGSELELRELQRSGRIGRIEVNTETRGGKTQGEITIPSSLDKAETAIVASALEIIQRIGPCNAKIHTTKIEDVRISKRKYVVDRAKELLKALMDDVMPDSQEIADEVIYSVRTLQITEFGPDKLPAGPAVEDADEVIVVEGRADVVNLLKHGFNNAIAINGTSVPQTVIDLSKKKVVTAFLDGDRGGDIILKELIAVADIDFVTKASTGMEVEEITKKEIHQALRSRVAFEQAKMDLQRREADNQSNNSGRYQRRPDSRSNSTQRRPLPQRRPDSRREAPVRRAPRSNLNAQEKVALKALAEDLIGTRGASLVDKNIKILGKVPVTEMASTVANLSECYAVVFDGVVDKETLSSLEGSNLKVVVGMDSKVSPQDSRIEVATIKEL